MGCDPLDVSDDPTALYVIIINYNKMYLHKETYLVVYTYFSFSGSKTSMVDDNFKII